MGRRGSKDCGKCRQHVLSSNALRTQDLVEQTALFRLDVLLNVRSRRVEDNRVERRVVRASVDLGPLGCQAVRQDVEPGGGEGGRQGNLFLVELKGVRRGTRRRLKDEGQFITVAHESTAERLVVGPQTGVEGKVRKLVGVHRVTVRTQVGRGQVGAAREEQVSD